ncbi:MAG: hypothetical protein JWM56_708 [Candidatus Peribacteria bacterium]|nr:hypothetical protein [Candidatus Peribacteria bacterium]
MYLLSPLHPYIASALVLNYRSPRETVGCVRALLAQTIADQLEVLIIDNYSDDDSIGIIRNTFSQEPKVRMIEKPLNTGYGAGNNKGENYATGKYLLIINPDNKLEPDGLEKMIHAMEADETIGILAPKLVHEDGSIRESARSFPTVWGVFIKRTLLRHFFRDSVERYLHSKEDPTKTRDVDWVVGACFLMRRTLFKELQGFDERFFLFFEDADLCRRIWQTGKRVVYFPHVQATDRKLRLSQGGFVTIFTKWTVREHLKSAARYFWKWRRSFVR